MSSGSTRRTTLALTVASLACWLVMFAAGTDVWHDSGRPDLWNAPGVPWHDLRAFVVTFYVLLLLLLAQLAVIAVTVVRARRVPRPFSAQ